MSQDGGEEPRRPGKGFSQGKREDHGLTLMRDLMASLHDLPRVRRILLELGRYYDPVIGGAIMGVDLQRLIVLALEEGRAQEALDLIRARYDLYTRDRAGQGGPSGD